MLLMVKEYFEEVTGEQFYFSVYLEHPDEGFIQYKVFEDGELTISDIYTDPQTDLREFLTRVTRWCQGVKGARYITFIIHQSSDELMNWLMNGWRIKDAANEKLLLIKELF